MYNKFLIILVAIALLLAGGAMSRAATVDELRAEIARKNAELALIQKEIEQFESQIATTAAEAATLKKALAALELAKKKLLAEIRATEKKISIATTNIVKLDREITNKTKRLELSAAALGKSMRNANDLESRNLIELLLSNSTFSDIWEDIDNMRTMEETLRLHIIEVRETRTSLQSDKTEKEKEKQGLVALKNGLSDQQKLVQSNAAQKSRVLAETKSKESEYKKLLADRLAKKNQLEREIFDFESRLKVEIDPTRLPSVGTGVLSWPLDRIRITQYFGMTAFATKNPQVYNGNGHNGVDFSASPGTPVKAALGGRVVDSGDTDTACYGVSYGKWVLVEHANGLSTLYAHLDLVKAAPGEWVETGQVVGYSGNTGYSTGPHLHFAVFASQAVHVSGPTEYRSRVCGTYLKLPVSPPAGYLNPLSYL